MAAYDKFGVVEAPPRSDPLSKFADGPVFLTMIYAVILLNCLFMVIAADEEIHLAINRPDEAPSDFVVYGEQFFIVVYFLEFLIKFWRYRLYFFCDENWRFNWLDFALLVLGIYSSVFEGLLPNFTWMRMLRILKLAKALRIFRLISIVKPLRAILKSLMSTVDTLAWSCIMLGLILFLFALVLVIRVASFFQDENPLEYDSRLIERLGQNFGNIGVTMLHLFMCSTGGNDWSVYYEPLEPTGTINCSIFCFFIAFTQIALLNIILGIFVDDAMKNMMAEKEERAQHHAEEQRQTARELRELCEELDMNGDNMLSMKEWRRAMEKDKFRNYLDMMDFRSSEVADFLDLICENAEDGKVDIETFVGSCMRFKGSASCFDMQIVLHAVDELKGLLLDNRGVK
jgi:hypothetical protein